MDYIDQIIQDCKTAKNTKPTRSFVMKDLSELQGITKAIYVIKEIDGDNKSTFDAFASYKILQKSTKEKPRKCARINGPSNTLYVGSSTTGLKTRIKQHLGDGNASTYALHLKHWIADLEKIQISIYDYSDNEGRTIKKEVLQIIEDSMAFDSMPAFGKRGSNGR